MFSIGKTLLDKVMQKIIYETENLPTAFQSKKPWSKEMKLLLEKCTDKEPKNRPLASQLLKVDIKF